MLPDDQMLTVSEWKGLVVGIVKRTLNHSCVKIYTNQRHADIRLTRARVLSKINSTDLEADGSKMV